MPRKTSHKAEMHEWKRATVDIRRVLLEVWDPIGVRDVPQAQDEYDCCIPGLLRLLAGGGTDDQLAEFLWKQGTEHMGLSLEKPQMYPTVAALRLVRITQRK